MLFSLLFVIIYILFLLLSTLAKEKDAFYGTSCPLSIYLLPVTELNNDFATEQRRIHVNIDFGFHLPVFLTWPRPAFKVRSMESAPSEQVLKEARETAAAATEIAEVEALERIAFGVASRSIALESVGLSPLFTVFVILCALLRVVYHIVSFV